MTAAADEDRGHHCSYHPHHAGCSDNGSYDLHREPIAWSLAVVGMG